MSKIKVGDLVYYNDGLYTIREAIVKEVHGMFLESNRYTIELVDNKTTLFVSEKRLIKREGVDKTMSNEEKELKKDVEILLNIYLSNRKMSRKEIKRFSERHFDIIEKQNAKNTLKRRGK